MRIVSEPVVCRSPTVKDNLVVGGKVATLHLFVAYVSNAPMCGKALDVFQTLFSVLRPGKVVAAISLY